MRPDVDLFLRSARQQRTGEASENFSHSYGRSLDLFTVFFANDQSIDDITPSRLRDFLARWYVEQASAQQAEKAIPPAQEMMRAMREFFSWAEPYSKSDKARQCREVIAELERSVSRAVEIFITLSSYLSGRGGAFGFPEFLASFEDGGRAEYDIDTPGEAGAMEGYFRLIRIEGSLVEAEELIAEERVWPIFFPQEVARLIEPGYIINLETIRVSDGWRITSCGFAYPPGTEILEE